MDKLNSQTKIQTTTELTQNGIHGTGNGTQMEHETDMKQIPTTIQIENELNDAEMATETDEITQIRQITAEIKNWLHHQYKGRKITLTALNSMT